MCSRSRFPNFLVSSFQWASSKTGNGESRNGNGRQGTGNGERGISKIGLGQT